MVLATCADLPQLEADERLVIPELARLGVGAIPAVWDGASQVWSEHPLVVVRSTWDYSDRRHDFLTWAAALPGVLNPLPVLAWNTDKTYLRELGARGIPTVATIWVEPGTDLGALALPDGEVVVKPAVSAGSRNTERYADARSPAARAHVQRLLDAGRTVMVQPYVESVDRDGETALMFFDGVYSHAIRKAATLRQPGAAAGRLFAPESITAAEPTPDDHALAKAVLDALQWPRGDLLYARVDVVHGDDGRPSVLEVELTEPSLFLGWSDGAAARFAAAIERRL